MRFRLLLLALVTFIACDADKKPQTETTSTRIRETSPPPDLSGVPVLEPRPKLRSDTVTARGERGLVVKARLLVATLSGSDEARIRLSFGHESGALSAKSGLGAERFDWSETFDHLKLTATGPKGETRELTAAGSTTPKPKPMPLAWLASGRVLYLGTAGVSDAQHRSSAAWSTPPDALFPLPGRYTLELTGTLELPSGPLAFETGQLAIEVKDGKALTPLTELETKATDYVKTKFPGLTDAPWPTLPTMEDVEGGRVMRYSVSRPVEGYDVHFVEVVMSGDGKVLSMTSETFFRCIAEGVPIATPDGPRAVEQLRVGDRVIGFDLARRERVVTKVRASWRSHTEQLVELAPGSLVSDLHPVFADGRWVEARQLRSGAMLTVLDGAHVAATVRPLSGGSAVYDLAVDWPHTYFAGNVLVHNKAAPSKEATWMRTDVEFRPKSKR